MTPTITAKQKQKLTRLFLQEMFARVNAEFTPEMQPKDRWYLAINWGDNERLDFAAWATFKLLDEYKLQAHDAVEIVKQFLQDYGWGVKETIIHSKNRGRL